MSYYHTGLELTDSYVSSVTDGSPRVYALDLDYAKQHIRALPGTADDALTLARIDAAAQYFEEQTGRQLLTARREAWIDGFPYVGRAGLDARIELPRPPLQRVVDIQYLDGNGVWHSYGAGSPLVPYFRTWIPKGVFAPRGTVEPAAGRTWPSAQYVSGSVKIIYDCGYGSTPNDIPALIRGILCFLVAHFDTFVAPVVQGSVNVLPLSVNDLISAFKYSAYPSQRLRAQLGCGWTPW